MPQRLIEPFCVVYSGYFLILNIFTDCKMMFQEVSTQLEALKKDVNDLKAGRSMAAEMDDLESLFSSLESEGRSGQQSPPFVHLALSQQQGPLSPPCGAPGPGMFRPRANSVPPIYLEPALSTIPGLASSQAQQLRTSASPNFPQSAPIPDAPPNSTGFQMQLSPVSQPLLSPPLLSGPQSGPPSSSLAPLPIPGYMPIKKPEVVVSQNMHQLKKETIGRLVTKLARSSYFGEDILARSSVAGGGDKHPLDPS